MSSLVLLFSTVQLFGFSPSYICAAFLRGTVVLLGGSNMMLRTGAVALRRLECAASSQCFGDTPAWELTHKLDFWLKQQKTFSDISLWWRLPSPPSADRWWWRPKLVLISDKTDGRLQEVKKTPGFYREIFHCDSKFNSDCCTVFFVVLFHEPGATVPTLASFTAWFHLLRFSFSLFEHRVHNLPKYHQMWRITCQIIHNLYYWWLE